MAEKTITRTPKRAASSRAKKASPATNGVTPVLAEHEEWLYNNPEAMAAVERGLDDSAAGWGVKKSFPEFADINRKRLLC